MKHALLSFALIASAPDAAAAVPTGFARFEDNPSVVRSVEALHKGDVIEIHGFKAEPGTRVALGMCDRDCRSIHLIKAVPIARVAQTVATERITLPEDGQIFIWVLGAPQQNLNGAAAATGSGGSGTTGTGLVSDAVRSYFSGPGDGDAQVLPIRQSEVEADRIKLRFDKSCFITISRVSTTAP
ncbi:MAG: hypothetical protein ABW187_07430 [Dokdonella sp.]